MSHCILDAIGHTPLIEIRKMNPNPRVRLLAKLEYFNPGGSIKDRAALYMINAGEASGLLTPAKTVIEATSGNTGIGLALVCAVKGYRLLLAMSEAASMERQKILRARGAEILLTPGHLGTDGAIEEVYRLARENPAKYFMTDQFNNPANWQAHYSTTAEELWRQTEGRLTLLVATMGTTGTVMGLQRRLKELDSAIRIVGVEPYFGHKIQGLKNMKEAYCPEIYEKERLDKKVNIDDDEAFETTRRLAREEGLFVGMSSGAAMAVALKEAAALSEGTVVAVMPDGGERYLSTSLFTVREHVDLRLFNTLHRSCAPFEPRAPGKVFMYSCGPTAHARMNPDECRRMVFADLVARYLEFRGYAVTHIMNITDLDDKTIVGSDKAGMDLDAFTGGHIDTFHKDLALLNIKPASAYPLVSEHVEEIVEVAGKLLDKGFAYEKLRSIYFNIGRLSDYGRLSGIDLEKIRLGATVDLDEYEKDNPRDFTLLKRSRLSELKRGIYTKTKWGNVRPSWHIQCAAIAMKYLGAGFDIHTAGRSLVFPHHENENAIAAALTGKPLARCWLHCEHVEAEDAETGGGAAALSLKDLLDQGFSGREIRYWLLSRHYRKPIVLSPGRLRYARASLQRLDACIRALAGAKAGRPYPEVDQILYDIRQGFTCAMDDDLNTSAALGRLFKILKRINILLHEDRLDAGGGAKIVAAFRGIDEVLRIFDFEGAAAADSETERLMAARETARKARNFALADKLRQELIARGVTPRDGKVFVE